jgi:hypothetical protein
MHSAKVVLSVDFDGVKIVNVCGYDTI